MGIMWGGVEILETPENGPLNFEGTVRKYHEGHLVLTDRLYSGEHTSKWSNADGFEEDIESSSYGEGGYGEGPYGG